MQAFEKGRQGLERIAYLTSLTKSYSVTLSMDSSLCDSSLKTKNASEIIYPGCSKFKTYEAFVCTGRVYDFDVFQIP